MKKKTCPPRRTRFLSLEGLEDRRLLAAVSFNARSGLLTINGTSASETVDIVAVDGVPGTLNVSGDVSVAKDYSGVRSVRVNMNAGDDTINIGTIDDPVELLGPVTINLGAGSDTANLYINTIGIVNVNGGSDNSTSLTQNQNDTVVVGNSIINRLIVNTYAGDDTLEINSSAIAGLVANVGVASLRRNQTDSDIVSINDSAIGTVSLLLGTAEKPPLEEPTDISLFQVGPISGQNTVEIHSTLLGNAVITGGNAVDVVGVDSNGVGIGDALDDMLVDLVDDLEPLINSFVSSSQFRSLWNMAESLFGVDMGPLSLSGLDFEEIDLSDLLAGFFAENPLDGLGAQTLVGLNLVINTGAGNDIVGLSNIQVFGLISALLLTGDDTLIVENVSSARAIFNGGPHTKNIGDTYVDLGNPNLGYQVAPIIVLFEHFESGEIMA